MTPSTNSSLKSRIILDQVQQGIDPKAILKDHRIEANDIAQCLGLSYSKYPAHSKLFNYCVQYLDDNKIKNALAKWIRTEGMRASALHSYIQHLEHLSPASQRTLVDFYFYQMFYMPTSKAALEMVAQKMWPVAQRLERQLEPVQEFVLTNALISFHCDRQLVHKWIELQEMHKQQFLMTALRSTNQEAIKIIVPMLDKNEDLCQLLNNPLATQTIDLWCRPQDIQSCVQRLIFTSDSHPIDITLGAFELLWNKYGHERMERVASAILNATVAPLTVVGDANPGRSQIVQWISEQQRAWLAQQVAQQTNDHDHFDRQKRKI